MKGPAAPGSDPVAPLPGRRGRAGRGHGAHRCSCPGCWCQRVLEGCCPPSQGGGGLTLRPLGEDGSSTNGQGFRSQQVRHGFLWLPPQAGGKDWAEGQATLSSGWRLPGPSRGRGWHWVACWWGSSGRGDSPVVLGAPLSSCAQFFAGHVAQGAGASPESVPTLSLARSPFGASGLA